MREIDRPFLLKQYSAPNWFTELGVWQKRRQIEKKGLPVLKRCLFVTFTLDPIIGDPKESYKKGKDRIRRFLSHFRKVIGRKFPWAWKLEFQESGYAHWHLIIDYRKKIPRECLRYFDDWWGLGRVNVKRLRQKDFRYLFKYVSKMAVGDEDESGISLPSWVLDFYTITKDGRKSGGMRFWQTGGGFYTNETNANSAKKTEKRSSRIPFTIRDQVRFWDRRAVAYFRAASGQIKASKRIHLNGSWKDLNTLLISYWLEGKTALIEFSWKCCQNHIQQHIDKWTKKQISQMQRRTFNLVTA